MAGVELNFKQREYLAAAARKRELVHAMEAIKKQIGRQHTTVAKLAEQLTPAELAAARTYLLKLEAENAGTD